MKFILEHGIRFSLVASLIFLLGTMFYFATVQNSPLPYHSAVDGWNDLILHVGAFGLLTVIALLIMQLSWQLIGILFLVCCIMEMVQFFIPNREVDAWDLAANAFGVLLGTLVVFAARKLLWQFSIRRASFKE